MAERQAHQRGAGPGPLMGTFTTLKATSLGLSCNGTSGQLAAVNTESVRVPRASRGPGHGHGHVAVDAGSTQASHAIVKSDFESPIAPAGAARARWSTPRANRIGRRRARTARGALTYPLTASDPDPDSEPRRRQARDLKPRLSGQPGCSGSRTGHTAAQTQSRDRPGLTDVAPARLRPRCRSRPVLGQPGWPESPRLQATRLSRARLRLSAAKAHAVRVTTMARSPQGIVVGGSRSPAPEWAPPRRQEHPPAGLGGGRHVPARGGRPPAQIAASRSECGCAFSGQPPTRIRFGPRCGLG